MQHAVLLSITYFGPLQYYAKFIEYPERIIEQYDHYNKQTYRNRCVILGGNGSLPLSVPVLKGSEHKTLLKDVRIDYSKNWRKLHWKGIESAYRHSPFFEYFQDDILELLDPGHEYLIDLNLKITDFILGVLEIEGGYSLSNEYLDPSTPEGKANIASAAAEYPNGSGLTDLGRGAGLKDLRDAIHPKKDAEADIRFRPVKYTQVFSDRHGFQPNLSILDLLFNTGPDAKSLLEECIPAPGRQSKNNSPATQE